MAESSTIWHYTDAAGLLGVLGSNPEPRDANVVGPQSCRPEFRATAVEYLNDSRELIHGLGILKGEVLLKRADELERIDYQPHERHEIANAPAKAKFIRALCESIEMVEKRTYEHHIHCYVTSFSENPDTLSQWRGYCGGLDGFAIGIDKSKLPDTPEAKAKKVVYSDSLTASSAVADNAYGWLDWRLAGTDAPDASPGCSLSASGNCLHSPPSSSTKASRRKPNGVSSTSDMERVGRIEAVARNSFRTPPGRCQLTRLSVFLSAPARISMRTTWRPKARCTRSDMPRWWRI